MKLPDKIIDPEFSDDYRTIYYMKRSNDDNTDQFKLPAWLTAIVKDELNNAYKTGMIDKQNAIKEALGLV